MADSADLIVLGAYFGTGNKGKTGKFQFKEGDPERLLIT